MLLALVLALLPQVPVPFSDIQARVPHTSWVVSLNLSGWKEADESNPLRKTLGDKLVFCGTLQPAGTTLTLIAEANTELISPTSWRKRLAPPGESFECQLAACVDATVKKTGGPEFDDFHAYVCAAGWCFDLHVSRAVGDPKNALTRGEFERIVKTMRFLFLRRGWAEYYPDEFAYDMTLAALSGPGRRGWKENVLPKRGEDWIAQLVEAELTRADKAAPEVQIALYRHALELIAKLEKPGPKERYAWAIACDGLSLALGEAKQLAEAVPVLERGYALLEELGRKERAALAYNLACAQALLKHENEALAALERAIGADEFFRAAAAKDEDFAALRSLPAFQKLVAKPEPKPAK